MTERPVLSEGEYWTRKEDGKLWHICMPNSKTRCGMAEGAGNVNRRNHTDRGEWPDPICRVCATKGATVEMVKYLYSTTLNPTPIAWVYNVFTYAYEPIEITPASNTPKEKPPVHKDWRWNPMKHAYEPMRSDHSNQCLKNHWCRMGPEHKGGCSDGWIWNSIAKEWCVAESYEEAERLLKEWNQPQTVTTYFPPIPRGGFF